MPRFSLFNQRPRLLATIIPVAALLPLTILLIFRHLASPHSSDDVAVQVALGQWLAGHHHITYLPSDNFLFKLPVYLVAALLPFTPQMKLLFQVLVLNLSCFGLFMLGVSWLASRTPLRTGSTRGVLAVTIPALWLMLLGGSFGINMLVANYRNIELGVAFIILGAAYRYAITAAPFKQKLSRRRVTGITLVLSFFWFSDPFFLLLVGAPLAVGIWGWAVLQRPTDRRLLSVSYLMVLSGIISKFWLLVAHWVGIEISGSASVSLSGIIQRIELFWPSLADLLGISFHVSNGRSLSSLLILAVGLVGFGACAANAWTGWRHRQFFLWFMGLQPLVIFAGFILSSYIYDIGAGRYLVLIPYYLALNLAVLFARLPRRVWADGLLALMLCSAVVSLAVDTRELSNRRLYPGTTEQTKLLQALKQTGITKGYGGYWSANLNTYLTNGHPHITPIDCIEGHLKPLYWFMDDAAFRQLATRTLYVYEAKAPQATECSLPALAANFGAPQQTIKVDDDTQLLLYDYDIGQKFVLVR